MTFDAEAHRLALVIGAVLAIALPLIVGAALLLRGRKPELAREISLRYVTWVGLAAAFLGALWLGREAWIALVGLVGILAFREYARAVGLWLDRSFLAVCYLFVALFHVAAWWPWDPLAPGRGWYGIFQAMPAYAVLAVLAVPIFRGRFENMVQRTCLSVLGVVYLGWLFAHLSFLINLPHGPALALFLLLLVALNDVSAFILGKLFGRHKLRPTLSPGKTWEGAIGATLAVLAAALLLRGHVSWIPMPHLILLALLISIGAILGDLALSVIKRDLGLKDWSAAIPGHGGILDRTNSLVFTVPLFFHYVRYFFGA